MNKELVNCNVTCDVELALAACGLVAACLTAVRTTFLAIEQHRSNFLPALL